VGCLTHSFHCHHRSSSKPICSCNSCNDSNHSNNNNNCHHEVILNNKWMHHHYPPHRSLSCWIHRASSTWMLQQLLLRRITTANLHRRQYIPSNTNNNNSNSFILSLNNNTLHHHHSHHPPSNNTILLTNLNSTCIRLSSYQIILTTRMFNPSRIVRSISHLFQLSNNIICSDLIRIAFRTKCLRIHSMPAAVVVIWITDKLIRLQTICRFHRNHCNNLNLSYLT